ncbi:MAG: coenzyme F420-0:L-glutamate ligase [Thaumarchaeota archaeon]|nr:coenzyme F420-0:L-glutamate ligase [Candidatus Calditenuaceae archaeon]MDW8042531.1 coenzyme F420-0:L-glutamate ligase [Nitrososphaerota archaeon]
MLRGVRRVEVTGLSLPVVREGDDLAELIVSAAEVHGVGLRSGDIVVVSQIVVSKSEGRVMPLASIEASTRAHRIARLTGKDPRHVEAILREAVDVLRVRADGLIITETRHGLVCANSGVDLSNVGENNVSLLPVDPDSSARRIRERIRELRGIEVGVIVSDSHGRPFRRGAVNVAIGCSGIEPVLDLRGSKDLYGRVLQSKQVCVADELASAAELVMGNADEGIPVAIIRGYRYRASEEGAAAIVRPREEDLFR